jgi:hypothetical protein
MENKLPIEEKACRDLADALNVMTFKKDRFLVEFAKTHRYLQSEMFELALKLILFCSEDEYGTDGRNEWCKKVAKDIVAKADIYN